MPLKFLKLYGVRDMRSGWIKPAVFAVVFALAGCGQAMDKARAATAQDNLKSGQDFLAKTAKAPGVVVLPSGVMYRVVARSLKPGPQPTIADKVTINYEGKLITGQVFDSSYERHEPATFPLARLILAWQEAIPKMHVGDEIVLYTPPSAAYGERDMSPDIPPNSTLIFRVHLIAIGGE